jgi:MoxR-like ATPase
MRHEWEWHVEFTKRLVAALDQFPQMYFAEFRSLFLRRVGEELGLSGPFPVREASDPRDHLHEIVDACKGYKDKAAAVRALSAAMRRLRPQEGALAELDECAGLLVWQEDVEAAHDGRTVLEIGQFTDVLEAISRISTRYPLETIHAAVKLAAGPGEANPVRGTEGLSAIVRRLNEARQDPPVECPLVVRFLARLGCALNPPDAGLLAFVVTSITRDRGLSSADLGEDASQPPFGRPRKDLRVWVRNISPASGPPRYQLEAKIFHAGEQSSIASKCCPRPCDGHDIDNAAVEFTTLITQLSDTAGTGDVRVQFYLPLDLLAYPVDMWSCDPTGFAVGRRFPVVVRLLDRESEYRIFHEWWVKRWDALAALAADLPIADWISWLHDGESDVPVHAEQEYRVFDARRDDDLNRCLDIDRDPVASGLGLTFAFGRPNAACRNGVEAAIQQGVPLLIWSRDGRKASDLEGRLGTMGVGRLPDGVRHWRYTLKGRSEDSPGSDRGFVLMMDDPHDAPSPSQRQLMAPRPGNEKRLPVPEHPRPSPAWWIYKGTDKPHDTPLPPSPPWRSFTGQVPAGETRDISRDGGKVEGEEGSRRVGRHVLAEKYQADIEEINLVNLALHLRRPLLVTGRPGVGKSMLAYSVAWELKLGPVLYWPITSRATLRDGLYEYDAVGRLQEVSMRREAARTTRQTGTSPEAAMSEDGPGDPLGIGGYLRLGPLGTALLPAARPRVLLIDEIDKSDIDFPNDLLNIFEEGEFIIPELARLKQESIPVMTWDPHRKVKLTGGLVRCKEFPFVVLTSNAERNFPQAFLRRCIRLEIKPPSAKKLERLVEAHLGPAEGTAATVRQDLINKFSQKQSGAVLANDQLLNALLMAGQGLRDEQDGWDLIDSHLLKPLDES